MGESVSQERAAVAQLLRVAAQRIASGSAPTSGQNVSEPGNVAPTNCSYVFGAGSLNAPCSPSTGGIAGGTAVTIKGLGFAGAGAAVTFGGVAATAVTIVDDATITCTTPARAAGVVDVVIGSPGRQTLLGAFTYA